MAFAESVGNQQGLVPPFKNACDGEANYFPGEDYIAMDVDEVMMDIDEVMMDVDGEEFFQDGQKEKAVDSTSLEVKNIPDWDSIFGAQTIQSIDETDCRWRFIPYS